MILKDCQVYTLLSDVSFSDLSSLFYTSFLRHLFRSCLSSPCHRGNISPINLHLGYFNIFVPIKDQGMLDSKKQISNKVIWGTVVLEWEIYFAMAGSLAPPQIVSTFFLSKPISALACFQVDMSNCDSVETLIGSTLTV